MVSQPERELINTLVLPGGSPGPCWIARLCGFRFDIYPPPNVSDNFSSFEFTLILNFTLRNNSLEAIETTDTIHFILDVLLGSLLN